MKLYISIKEAAECGILDEIIKGLNYDSVNVKERLDVSHEFVIDSNTHNELFQSIVPDVFYNLHKL